MLVPPPTVRLASRARAALAACLLAGAPAALAQQEPASDAAPRPSDAPLASPESESESGDIPSGPALMPGMSGVPASFPEDAPLSTGAKVAHVGFLLLPAAGIYGAWRLGDAPLVQSAAEMGAGAAAAYLPAQLLFLRISPGGRWQELEVAGFGAGLVLTPALSALGTWGLGELAFERSARPGRAYLWTLAGAASGMALGVVAHEVLDRLAGNSKQWEWLRRWVTLGLIGAGASAGYQWGTERRRSSGASPGLVPE